MRLFDWRDSIPLSCLEIGTNEHSVVNLPSLPHLVYPFIVIDKNISYIHNSTMEIRTNAMSFVFSQPAIISYSYQGDAFLVRESTFFLSPRIPQTYSMKQPSKLSRVWSKFFSVCSSESVKRDTLRHLFRDTCILYLICVRRSHEQEAPNTTSISWLTPYFLILQSISCYNKWSNTLSWPASLFVMYVYIYSVCVCVCKNIHF